MNLVRHYYHLLTGLILEEHNSYIFCLFKVRMYGRSNPKTFVFAVSVPYMATGVAVSQLLQYY